MLLIALACYFFIVEKGEEKAELQVKAASLMLLDLPDGITIRRIRITTPAGSFAFEGKDDVWRIIDPILEMGNALMLGGIEKVLTLQRKERILNKTAADISVYGLDPAEIMVNIMTDPGRQERTLYIGKKAPFEELYYAKWSNEKDVFLLIANARNALFKELSEVRNRNIFSVAQQDRITRVECVLPVFTVKLALDMDNDRWLIKEPFEELAKTETVDELIGKIKGLYIEKFLDDDNVTDPKFGLIDSPSYITIGTAYDKETTLRLGAMTEEGKLYYAHLEGRNAPIMVAADMLDSLRKDPNEFIERRIAHFNSMSVNKIVYQKGGNERVIDQIGNEWHLNNTKLDEEKATRVIDLLDHLSGLEYTIVLNDEGIKKFKLAQEKPLFSFQVSFAVPQRGADLIGYQVYAKGDGFFVTSTLDENFYEITKEDYGHIVEHIDVIYD